MATKNAKVDNRRPETERALDEHGISYSYVQQVALDQLERHSDSQSRLRAVDKAQVRRYANSMEAGAVFPPLVLWEDGTDGSYLVVDGGTRVEAKKIHKDIYSDAYLVKLANKGQAIQLSAMFNGLNGQPLTKQEIVRAVLAADAQSPRPTNTTIARDYGITEQRVGKIVRTADATKRLVSVGVDVECLGQDAIHSCATIADLAVLRAVGELIIDSDMKTDDLKALIKEVNDKGSETDRLAVIDEARAALHPVIHAKRTGCVVNGNPVRPAGMVFGRLLSLIKEYPEVSTWVPIDSTRRSEYQPKVEQIASFLSKVAEAYDNTSTGVAAVEAGRA